jgi:hypothetical protein
MATVRVKLEAGKSVAGRIDARKVDATTEADLKRQAAEEPQLIVPGPVEYVGPAKNESPTLVWTFGRV